MKLEQSDAELFYQLWFPLLDFVNRKHHVYPETETIGQRKGIDARNAKKTLGCLLLYAARFDAYVFCTFRQENASDFLAHRHIPSTFRENLTGKAGSAIMLPDQS